jgi:hypothetical protein
MSEARTPKTLRDNKLIRFELLWKRRFPPSISKINDMQGADSHPVLHEMVVAKVRIADRRDQLEEHDTHAKVKRHSEKRDLHIQRID